MMMMMIMIPLTNKEKVWLSLQKHFFHVKIKKKQTYSEN